MATITITVPGKPSRWMRPGEYTDPKTGITRRVTDKKAEAGKKHIRDHAVLAYRGIRPATGPVLVCVRAIFEIPPSWPKALIQAAHECRVMHVADPDIDQCVKQALDALRGIAFVDDNQVCGFHPAPAKRYGAPERTEIIITTVDQKEDEKTPGQRRLEKRIEVEGWDAVLAPPKRRKKPAAAGSSGLAPGYIESIRGTVAFKPGVLFGRRGKR